MFASSIDDVLNTNLVALTLPAGGLKKKYTDEVGCGESAAGYCEVVAARSKCWRRARRLNSESAGVENEAGESEPVQC